MFFSSFPMKVLAYAGASLEPMAVPNFWSYVRS